MRVRPTLACAAVAAGVLLAACGSSGGSGGSASAPSATTGVTSSASPEISGTVTVLAASSLTGTFTQLGHQFDALHPGTTVKFSFGASSALAQQIINGAPADVFASASPKNMTQVGSKAVGSTTFVKNQAEIATEPGNPKHITSLADLAKPGLKVALCQAQVPCGVVAQSAFGKAHVTVKPVTLGPDVKSVLTDVELKEADAGVVYKTDVQAAGSKVTGVEIPDAQNATTSYPIASISGAKNEAGAKAFVAYVLSTAGRQVLTQAGFQQP